MKQETFLKRTARGAVILSLIVFACFVSAARAQTKAFTYQGRLTDAGMTTATGAYLFKFELYDAAANGNLIDTLADVAVNVSNGAFTTELNFTAANAFDGGERYLLISVKRSAGDAYTALSPRQHITSTPYAIRSLNASNVEMTTAGNSVVISINNAATNTTINSSRLAADVVRLKPASSQTSTTQNSSDALLDVTGITTDTNNTTLSTSRFRFKFDGNLLLTGNQGFGTIPAEGAGTRLMWYPGKSAFRAGYVNGTEWNEEYIGSFSAAFGQNTRASADSGFAAGKFSTAANVSTVALGEGNTASGAASVALGYGAHTNARQGTFVFADRSVPLVYDSNGNLDTYASEFLRAGVNHSATWRVSGGFRIFTSSNLSTGVTLQSGATTSNWGQANAVISTSTGAYLSTSGVWTNNSSVNLKTNFAPVDARLILRKVLNLPVTTWNYKVDDASVRHIGAMAQDFYKAFKVGADDEHLTAVDTAGVTLAAIQGLNAELKDELKARDERIEAQNAQIKSMQTQLDALKKLICASNNTADVCQQR